MCIGGPKLLRQGRAKAKPRPRQGATRKKRTTDAPKGSPKSSYWSYWAPFLSIFETVLFNLWFLWVFSRVLRNLRLIFKGFSLSGPRILQYLTVNLKVFAYCSESLRKRVRGLQNAPKMLLSCLPRPLWGLMRGLWSSKLVPKSP